MTKLSKKSGISNFYPFAKLNNYLYFCGMKIEISRVTECSDSLVEAFERLLPQLSSSAKVPTVEYIKRMVASPSLHLLVASDECGKIVGMLSLFMMDIPTGRKAYIEDVVTDTACRGCGVGQRLVEEAISMARSEEVKRIYLTSNPSREAAHALYRKCGFDRYDTFVFRYEVR